MLDLTEKIRKLLSGQQNKTAGTRRGNKPCSWHCPQSICRVLMALSLGLTFCGHVIYPQNHSAHEVKSSAVNNTLGILLLLGVKKAARECHSHPNKKMLHGVQKL